jgi:hypothetical protein
MTNFIIARILRKADDFALVILEQGLYENRHRGRGSTARRGSARHWPLRRAS